MKVFAISDLHFSVENEKPMNIFGDCWNNYIEIISEDWKAKVSDEDVVVLSGDLSWAMKLEDTASCLKLLAALPGKKIIIKGNHDYWWKSISNVRSILPDGFYALQNDAVKIGDFVFAGTRLWTVPEKGESLAEDEKIFKREALRLEMALVSAKQLMDENSKLVVMVHFPPFNSKREDSLFTDLCEKFEADSVVYGHLHGANVRADKIFLKNGIKYYLTSCDLIKNNLVEIF